MKKSILTIAFLSASALAFAQKAELSAADKAYKAGDLSTALTEVKKAQAIIKENANTVAPGMVAKAMYLEGKSLYAMGANGDEKSAKAGVGMLGKLLKYEKGKVFAAKNVATKTLTYFNNQKQLDAAVASGEYSGPKVTPRAKTYTAEIQPLLTDVLSQTLKKGEEVYNAGKFDQAGDVFAEAFNINTQIGGDVDTMYLYNAAICYQQAQNWDKAVDTYKKLLAMNFSGERTTYLAERVDNNQLSSFANEKDRDAQVKLGLYKNPTVQVDPNKQPDIYRVLVQILYQEEKFDDVIELIHQARAKYPQLSDLILIEGQIYYNRNESEKFITTLETAVAEDPNNVDILAAYAYALSENDKKDKAVEVYNKIISIKPEYANAYVNLASMILDEEQDINAKIDALPIKLNVAQEKQYNALLAQKKVVYKRALPLLEKAYQFDPANRGVILTLKNIYYQIEDDANYKKFDEAEKAL